MSSNKKFIATLSCGSQILVINDPEFYRLVVRLFEHPQLSELLDFTKTPFRNIDDGQTFGLLKRVGEESKISFHPFLVYGELILIGIRVTQRS